MEKSILIRMLGIGALAAMAAYFVFSKPNPSARDDAAEARVQQLEREKAALRRQLQSARATKPIIVTAGPLVASEEEAPQAATPEQILTLLQQLKPTDKRALRRLVYFLESLVERGDPALPAIAAFLNRNVDLEFPVARSAGVDDKKNPAGKKTTASAWNYFRPFPRPTGVTPATLRLGLLEAVAAIGTMGAEELLLNILDDTARGVEVAYLEIALQDLARDQHVDKILAATRRLLTKLPPITADSMAVDRRAKGYLYAILVKYNDRIFVDTAKTLLITADGRLDGDVLRYLRQVLGTDALPIFHTVMNDDRLTDEIDRYAIRDAILRHIGADPKADVLLLQTMREGMAQQEEGGAFNWGAVKLPLNALMQGINEAPAQNIVNRRRLIDNFREEFDHPQLNSVLNKMDAGLEAAQQGVTPNGGK